MSESFGALLDAVVRAETPRDGHGFISLGPRAMAAGWIPGRFSLPSVGFDNGAPSPREAIAAIIRPALERSPCVVGFSGGRDSSLILAIAVRTAREAGLPLPVPVTKRFPGHSDTDESDWQDYVVRHLGLTEWVQQPFADELDLLGPAAQASLRRFGPLWPATLHNRAPHLELARGGSYLGGELGDEVLGEFRASSWVRYRHRQLRPRRRVAKEWLKVFGPAPVRRRSVAAALDGSSTRTWLKPDVRAWYARALMADEIARPLPYQAALVDLLTRRGVQIALNNLHAMGRSLDVRYIQPLSHPVFVESLAAHGPRLSYPSRTATLRSLFGDLLPDPVLARTSKATFNSVYTHRFTRDFVARWDGTGLDTDLIDVEALRDVWNQPVIHGGTFQLLHLAWLHAEGIQAR